MESNIKGLVTAGHEMASELKAECGAVDMRSVAKLISDLATQLEVQLARANALAEDQQKAIESIKQADSAVKLAHEKFSALAAENAGLKSDIPLGAKHTDRGSNVVLPAEEAEELARIALASLEAEPVSQTYNLPELIEGMEVSIDVSTCDADLGNRYFGTVTEALELDTAKNGYILLVQDAESNFDVNGNSPGTPDGWVMVPKELTPEMMRAVQIRSELGGYATSNLSGAYNMFSEFWNVAVSAAPKVDDL